MKPYRDLFGNKLSKQDVDASARLIVQMNRPSTSLLTRRLGIGYGKAARVIELLEDAGVVSLTHNAERVLLLRNEDAAVNAALRQLKKGKLK